MGTQYPWNDGPGVALWYGEVVYDINGETDYDYGYSAEAEAPTPLLMVPPGCEVLETLVRPTARNTAHFLWGDSPDGKRLCYMHPQQDGSPTQNCGTCARDRGE